MINNVFGVLNNLDKMTLKIMKYGLNFCFILCILSGLILLTYSLNISAPIFYYIGFGLFRLSLTFAVEFIICGIVVDGIKKQKI